MFWLAVLGLYRGTASAALYTRPIQGTARAVVAHCEYCPSCHRLARFVSGHGFSRAVSAREGLGL